MHIYIFFKILLHKCKLHFMNRFTAQINFNLAKIFGMKQNEGKSNGFILV